MAYIRGEAALELCRAVVAALEPHLPDGVKIEVFAGKRETFSMSTRGPKAGAIDGMGAFGTILPGIGGDRLVELAVGQILGRIRSNVSGVCERDWPGRGYEPAVAVSGGIATLRFVRSGKPDIDFGSITIP